MNLRGLRTIFVAISALAFAGCKTSSPLVESAARARLAQTVFAGPAAVQTVTFVSGSVEHQPVAIDQILYAKHWTTCETEVGALSSMPTCTLDAEGVSYGRANHWTSAPTPTPGCARCVTWTIPLATAELDRVTTIDVRDKSHADVTFTFVTVPNEFGRSLGEWLAGHELSWCGPNDRALGAWTQTRTGHAAFVRQGDTWNDVDASDGSFATEFAVAGDGTSQPCAR